MGINKNNLISDKNTLEKNKYVSITNFLDEETAEKIESCLKKDVPWGIATLVDGKSETFQHIDTIKKLDPNIQKKLLRHQSDTFHFIYNTYMIVTSYMEQRDPGHYLYSFLEWINSSESINYFRVLSGNSQITKINAQATRYMPGHYLKQHNDENTNEGRLYAYVYGLTKDWNPDWGGLLHILDDKGVIKKSFIPEFNTLNIFEVPQNHYVSYVTPFAEKERLAITGWLLK